MRGLGALRGRLDDAQLVEGGEDNSLGRTELWLENLDHRDLGSIKLQHASPSTSGRIVYPLSQLDDVEGGDFVSYCHGLSMLGNRIGSNQPWCCNLDGVVPRNECRRAAVGNHEADYPTGSAIWRSFSNLFDGCVEHRLCDGCPDALPVTWPYVEHTCPFRPVATGSEDPLQLGPLVPDTRSTRKRVSSSRRPCHASDARDEDFTCVRLRSILRVDSHPNVSQGR